MISRTSRRPGLPMLLGAAVLATGAIVPTAAVAQVSAPASASVVAETMTHPIYRVTNANGNTLLTPWEGEAKKAVANLGWEGYEVAFLASTKQTPGTVPVYRLYNDTTHTFLFTASPSERDSAAKYGFRYEMEAFYVPAWDRTGTMQVHRMHKVVSGKWRYRDVLGTQERAEAEAQGWIFDATVFRAVAPQTPAIEVEEIAAPDAPADETPVEEAPSPEAPQEEAPVEETPADPAPVVDERDGDGVFSLAQFNDTQEDVFPDSRQRMSSRVQWLLDNEESADIRMAVHSGDIVNWWETATNNVQYRIAAEELAPLLESTIPFAPSIGNHDGLAVADGHGWANTDKDGKSLAKWGLRQTQLINETIPADKLSAMAGQFEEGKWDNAFHTFTAEGADFLVLNLELWPRKEALNWGERVVAEHPEHNVIIVTHMYLNPDGTIGSWNGGYGDTSPRAMYNQIIDKYPNVKLVLSGHNGFTNHRIDTTSVGNTVMSVVTNMSPTVYGPLRVFEIDVDGDSVRTDVVRSRYGDRGHYVYEAEIDWIK